VAAPTPLWDRSRMKVLDSLEAGLAAGREKGCQLYASRAGHAIARAALGEARAGVPLRDDTLMFWISNTKPVMGVAFGQLIERRLVALDDPVARYLPAFGCAGKEPVTLAHLLTHTAGFRQAFSAWLPSPSFEEVVDLVCRAPQEADWVAGESAGYNVAAAWYVLAAVLQRVDGRRYRDYTREEIFLPLGMSDCWVGMTPETHAAYGDRIQVMPYWQDGEWKTGEAWGTPEGTAIERPGGNGYGPADQLVRLYEMLLGGGEREGVRVVSRETAALITRRHTEGLRDRTFGNVVFDRGLGVVVNSRHHGRLFNWYGKHASRDSYGHQGYFSSVAFADPVHDLAVALLFSGVREDVQHGVRVAQAIDALYEDLGIATS
jgi:CubicO group peptidase (beta-lactamase class C family)